MHTFGHIHESCVDSASIKGHVHCKQQLSCRRIRQARKLGAIALVSAHVHRRYKEQIVIIDPLFSTVLSLFALHKGFIMLEENHRFLPCWQNQFSNRKGHLTIT